MLQLPKINQKASTLVELLMVIVMVGILVALLANIPPSIGLIGRSHNQSLANQIATKQIEDRRSLPYDNLSLGESAISDPRLSMLPGSSGKVLVEDCDPPVCTNQEDVKQITVTVNWQESNKPQKLEIKTLVANGGLK